MQGQANIKDMLQLQEYATRASQQLPIEGDQFKFTNSQALNSAFRFRAYTFYDHQSPCVMHCRCVCHDTRVFKSPSKLKDALGILFVGYSGYPLRTLQRCTELSCVSQSVFRVYVHYVFPAWFLFKALMIAFNDFACGTINAALIVRRIVPRSSEIFRLVQLGDVDGVKELFRSGLASPNDSGSSGDTILRVCE